MVNLSVAPASLKNHPDPGGSLKCISKPFWLTFLYYFFRKLKNARAKRAFFENIEKKFGLNFFVKMKLDRVDKFGKYVSVISNIQQLFLLKYINVARFACISQMIFNKC